MVENKYCKTGQTMEKSMRRIRFAVLITLTLAGLTEGLCLAQPVLEPADLSTDAQEIRLAAEPAWSQNPVGKSLVMAQSAAQKKSVKAEKNPANQTRKPKPEQTEKPKPEHAKTPTSDRMAHYECLEYCAVVRQGCEGLATIQPDIKISTIGSKENNEWSRDCQKIYNGCMNKCDIDEKKVHWERANFAGSKNQRREGSLEER